MGRDKSCYRLALSSMPEELLIHFTPDSCRSILDIEDVLNAWVYQNGKGWWWRVDFLGAGPFPSQAAARMDVMKLVEEVSDG